MAKYPKARAVPYSSIVGSSVTLHDTDTERVIGQLAILNTGGDTPEDRKARQIAVADETAKRINAHDDLVAALSATIGNMMNAKIALDVGDTKAKVSAQLATALKSAKDALAKAKAGAA